MGILVESEEPFELAYDLCEIKKKKPIWGYIR